MTEKNEVNSVIMYENVG